MYRPSRIPILLGVLLWASALAGASLTAGEILARVDSVLNAPHDQKARMKMILIDKNGHQKVRVAESYQKGDDHRLIRFLEPADQRGIGFLSLPHDVMYVYLPAFKKVRRIASHVKHQTFAGTDFSYDDLATFKYSEEYDPQLLEETDSTYVLKLLPKPGSDKEYAYEKMWVDKRTFYPLRIEMYDPAGTLWKVMEFRRIEKINGYWVAREMEMRDLKRQHTTRMILEEIQLDTGIPDKVFTKRYLRRGI